MGERALVTGATGFIGSHLCRELLDSGWDVGALHRRRSPPTGRFDGGVDWLRADVLDRDRVRAAVGGYDAVFHLAGAGLTSADAGTVRRVNVDGTRNVVEACQFHGVGRLVFASTAGTFRSDGVATEADRAEPIGAYQESKTRAEAVVDRAAGDGLDAVTVHPASVFGPGDTTFTRRLIALVADPKMVAYLPGGASIVGIGDVVRGLIAAFERGETGEHYILGGDNLTYGEALDAIASHADGRRPFVRVPPAVVRAAGPVVGAINERFGTRLFPFDAEMARLVTRSLFLSSRKAERELGYAYEPFCAGVPDALEWYRDGAPEGAAWSRSGGGDGGRRADRPPSSETSP